MRNNDEIVAIIEGRMKELDLSLSELARRVGMAKSAISRYFNRTREFPLNRLTDFTEVLGLDPQHVLGFSENASIASIYNQLNKPNQTKVYNYADRLLHGQIKEDSTIYLVGETAAGSGREYSQLTAEKISAHVPKGADYALMVRGDSMEPLIEDESIIFYKEQPTVENGEIAIVEIGGGEVTCKKFYLEDDRVVLKSINDKYEDMIFDSGVRVIGKVII